MLHPLRESSARQTGEIRQYQNWSKVVAAGEAAEGEEGEAGEEASQQLD
jgi:hypothetical protein